MTITKKYFLKIISFVFSIVLVLLLFSAIDLQELLQRIKTIHPIYYCSAFFVYILKYLVRAFRVKVFFPESTNSLLKYSVFISVQQFLNRALPLRLGEAFFPVLLKKMLKVKYSDGVAQLIIIRIMDLITVFFSFIILGPFFNQNFDFSLYSISILIFILLLVGLTFLPLMLKTILSIAKDSKSLNVMSIKKFSENVATSFAMPKKIYFNVFFLSVIDKFLSYIIAYLLILGLNFNINLFELVAAITLSGITEILPINSIGSFGTTELGWAGALIYLGINKQVAVESGFGFNIMSFSFTLALGLLGYMIMTFYYKVGIAKKR